MAPEIIKNPNYTKESDLYALAITLWELFEECVPFYHIPESTATFDTFYNVVSQNNRPIFRFLKPYNGIKFLISNYWDMNPTKRAEIPLDSAKNVIDMMQRKL